MPALPSFREFVRLESAAGIILFLAAILGFIVSNSSLQVFYNTLLSHYHLSFLINDGLMTLFFLLVGLEIKRELLIGELNTLQKALLPLIAAIGGMLIPAIIFILFNFHDKNLLRGWAIPTATDIAFALAILNLLGNRIPLSLKVFLTALAIFDDLGAIVIIAIFYTQHIAWLYLLISLLIVSMLFFLHKYKISYLSLYFILGILLWFTLLRAGIHPTIAGVLLAFFIPASTTKGNLLQQLEHKLHAWVSYVILPLFAFCNSGIQLSQIHAKDLFNTLPLGIALGLLLGKQLGIFAATKIAVNLRWGQLPTACNWRLIYGAALLCGVGFTMSLFIGDLAFSDPSMANLVKCGIVTGSLISGISGYILLRWLSD